MDGYFREKLVLMIGTILSSGGTAIAAILSEGDVRWLLVTITVSMFTSVFLALGFRAEASIAKVISRAALSVIGVFVTRYLVHKWGLGFVDGDVVGLAGVTAAVCGACYLIGWPILEIIDKRRKDYAEKIVDKWKP